jgi:acetyl-CoA acetyltransferase
MSAMLKRYAPDASEALQLAARCQHIQRWKIARASYPMTKAGYYQWRTELKSFHADIARQVLVEAGYEQVTVERVCGLVMKALPAAAVEAQILEDVVVLVFLESYLEQFVASHADYEAEKFADILNKTLRKTSAKARSAAQTMIALPAGLRPLVVSLLIQFDKS